MKFLSFFLALLLHGVALGGLLTVAWHTPAIPKPALEIDLTTLAPPPEPMAADLPGAEPEPEPQPAAQAAPVKKAVPKPPKPKPSDMPSPPKMAKRPPPPPPPPPAPPAPEPEIRVKADEGVKDISPVKDDRPIVHVENDEEGRRLERQGRAVKLKGMDEAVHIKVGAEGRLMGGLAGYHFDENYYSGHYVTTTGRTVMVIDARETYGKLILYDSKTGLFRALHPTTINDFVYTYGPAFDQEEPIEGSVTFLPGDGHWIHRFIWLPADGAAEFPVMVRFKEKDVRFDSRGRHFSGKLVLPPDDEKHPAVVWVQGGACPQPGMLLEFARVLALNGIAALIYQPDDEAGTPQDPDTVASEALAAVRFLQNRPEIDPEKVGVWGVDCGKDAALRTVIMHGRADFLVVTLEPDPEEAERLAPILDKVKVPLLMIVPGSDQANATILAEKLRALPEVMRIGATVEDVAQSDEPLMEHWAQTSKTAALMDRYSPVHARLAAQWILSR